MKILEIHYLRAIAALLVLVQHACARNNIDFRLGHDGVDIFFIISGFVMWITTCGRDVSFRGFMLTRLRRVAPLYWIVTITTLGYYSIINDGYYGHKAGIEEIIKSFLFIPYHDFRGWSVPIVGQGWTLNIEMFFYLVFAVTVARCPRQRLWIPTGILTSLAVMGSLCKFSSAIGIVWTSSKLMELVAGLWLGYAYTSGWLRYRHMGWVLIMASIIVYSVCLYYGGIVADLKQEPPGPLYLTLLYDIPALALVAGCLMINHNRSIPEIPILVFLGDASYSVYLWHPLAIAATFSILHWPGVAGGIENALLLALCALPVTLLFYNAIERPLMARLPRPRVASVA